ncbi:2-dehydro-3-deoxygluconokinase [Virgibacillus halotolerans]|uniref:sugar kinase n=1 Tax=Virgibacillus halotolerans TaxID=1071053 RepID=UPI001961F108|nr:sugar kinase [Virgibacillus halotolerans]MBM7599104.1 2-dehydro-3-deoxygluconokinase [Virgibacillus halotolerans]
MEKRFDVTTIGEGSIRLSVGEGRRLNTASEFQVGISGAEANVVGGLSRLGWKTSWISSLPETPVGKRIRNEYRSHGINVEGIYWSQGSRVATLFVEYAKQPRSTKVIFDRENTCFTKITSEQVNWEYLLDSKIIHLTGITVPLSENTLQIAREAIEKAHRNDVKVSFDVNYRNNLWSSKEKACNTLLPMIQNVEILFCNKRDAQTVFNCSGTDEEIIKELQILSNANKVVMSRGSEGAMGLENGKIYSEQARDVVIIDRIGAGDGLAAGVLHGWLQGDFAKGLKYGMVTSALALSQYGEIVNTNVEELNQLLGEKKPDDIVR